MSQEWVTKVDLPGASSLPISGKPNSGAARKVHNPPIADSFIGFERQFYVCNFASAIDADLGFGGCTMINGGQCK